MTRLCDNLDLMKYCASTQSTYKLHCCAEYTIIQVLYRPETPFPCCTMRLRRHNQLSPLEARLWEPGEFLYLLPVDSIPPRLHVCHLPSPSSLSDTVVHQPTVIPRIQAQQWLKLNSARWKIHAPSVPLSKSLVLNLLLGGTTCSFSVHVEILGPPVGEGVWRASKVCRKDAIFFSLGHHEPDEAWAKHGARGVDEFFFEAFDGREGGLEETLEFGGHWSRLGSNTVEEEVVVVCH